MDHLEIRFVGDLQRLQPQPGDVYVLSVPQRIDTVTAARLGYYVSKAVGCSADKVLVIGDGLKLEVMAESALTENPFPQPEPFSRCGS